MKIRNKRTGEIKEISKDELLNYKLGGKLNKLGVKNSLWNNIRENAGSGKKPTPEMLEQERKIKSQYATGGQTNIPIYVTNPNDPRLQAYSDSMYAYNTGEKDYNYYLSFKNKVDNDIRKKITNTTYKIKDVKPIQFGDDPNIAHRIGRPNQINVKDESIEHKRLSLSNVPVKEPSVLDVLLGNYGSNNFERTWIGDISYQRYKPPVQPYILQIKPPILPPVPGPKPPVTTPGHSSGTTTNLNRTLITIPNPPITRPLQEEISMPTMGNINSDQQISQPINNIQPIISLPKDYVTITDPNMYRNPDTNAFQHKTYRIDKVTGKRITEPSFKNGGQVSSWKIIEDLPKAQNGKFTNPPIYVNDPKDPRLGMYNDSLISYNAGEQNYKNYLLETERLPKTSKWVNNHPYIPGQNNQPISSHGLLYNKYGNVLGTHINTNDYREAYRYKKPIQPYILQTTPPILPPTPGSVITNTQEFVVNTPTVVDSTAVSTPKGYVTITTGSSYRNPETGAFEQKTYRIDKTTGKRISEDTFKEVQKPGQSIALSPQFKNGGLYRMQDAGKAPSSDDPNTTPDVPFDNKILSTSGDFSPEEIKKIEDYTTKESENRIELIDNYTLLTPEQQKRYNEQKEIASYNDSLAKYEKAKTDWEKDKSYFTAPKDGIPFPSNYDDLSSFADYCDPQYGCSGAERRGSTGIIRNGDYSYKIEYFTKPELSKELEEKIKAKQKQEKIKTTETTTTNTDTEIPTKVVTNTDEKTTPTNGPDKRYFTVTSERLYRNPRTGAFEPKVYKADGVTSKRLTESYFESDLTDSGSTAVFTADDPSYYSNHPDIYKIRTDSSKTWNPETKKFESKTWLENKATGESVTDPSFSTVPMTPPESATPPTYTQYGNPSPTVPVSRITTGQGGYKNGGKILNLSNIKRLPKAQIGTTTYPLSVPTRTDSLNLYNNAMEIGNYFDKHPEYQVVDTKKEDEEDLRLAKQYLNAMNAWYKDILRLNRPPDVIKSAKDDVNRVKAMYDSLMNPLDATKANKVGVDRFNAPGQTVDLIKNGVMTENSTLPYNEYRNDINDNQYYQREQQNGTLNLDIPMQLFDKRINPDFKKKYVNELIHDGVLLYGYNPIFIKPYDLLTPEERIIVDQKNSTNTTTAPTTRQIQEEIILPVRKNEIDNPQISKISQPIINIPTVIPPKKDYVTIKTGSSYRNPETGAFEQKTFKIDKVTGKTISEPEFKSSNIKIVPGGYKNGGKVSSWEIIEDLPKAGNGLINSLMATLNPKNQGVIDYTKSGTRDQAYAAARKAGEKEFMWNNERFSTDMAGTPAQQLKWSGITNSQTENRSFFTPVNFAKDRLRKNLVPYGYTNPAGRVYDAIVKDKSTPFVSEDKRTVLGLKDVSPERRDAFKLYMNNPQENNTFGISNYTPSLKDKNSNNGPYYKINNLYGDPTEDDWFVNFFYNSNKNRVTDAALPNLIKTPFDNLTKTPPTLMNLQNDIMGHYKTSIGSDERGNYMSYYDKWDLNPKEVKNPITGKEIPTDIGKPFEIYDRVYFKDYGDGEEKRMYYTDKELKSFNTDKNTKNFDTIALQKELYNRGYKLPNSVKVVANEGDLKFDGIYGDETKKALQDFQNKKVEAPKMAVQKPGQSVALPPQFQKGGKTKKSNWQIIEY
jgi:hypothetical protein